MEIKKLREDKFEVILHIADLEKFHLDVVKFMSEKIEKLEFFPIILNYIDNLSCFSLKDKKIIFETFFIDNSYFLIRFHIIGILSSTGNFLPKTGNYMSISNRVSMIFKFSCFDYLCDFFRCLSCIDKKKLLFLLNFIGFFKYKNDYFMIIKNSIFYTDFFDFICLQISEFAEFVSCSDVLVNKIEEFGCNINMKC